MADYLQDDALLRLAAFEFAARMLRADRACQRDAPAALLLLGGCSVAYALRDATLPWLLRPSWWPLFMAKFVSGLRIGVSHAMIVDRFRRRSARLCGGAPLKSRGAAIAALVKQRCACVRAVLGRLLLWPLDATTSLFWCFPQRQRLAEARPQPSARASGMPSRRAELAA